MTQRKHLEDVGTRPGRGDIIREEIERRQRRRATLSRLGWHEILTEEVLTDPLFEDFWATFFSDGLRLPCPHMSWDISHAIGLPYNSAKQREFRDDLQRKCLPALKRCATDGQPWFAIENIHHTWYRIHLDEVPDDFDDWPVDLLPTGDPCYLVARDFSCGVISELGGELSVFGQPLLSDITTSRPIVLSNICRSNCESSDPG